MIVVGLLAAGRGERFGGDEPKQLAQLGGRPLLAHALDAARGSGVGPVDRRRVRRSVVAAVARCIEVLRNPDTRGGNRVEPRRSPARARRRARTSRRWSSVSPISRWSGPAAYRRVAAAYDDGARLAVATYGGRRGNPVLIAREHWPEALELAGDEGARVLLRRYGATEVPCDDTGDPTDVDTPADLAALEASMEIKDSFRVKHADRGHLEGAARHRAHRARAFPARNCKRSRATSTAAS